MTRVITSYGKLYHFILSSAISFLFTVFSHTHLRNSYQLTINQNPLYTVMRRSSSPQGITSPRCNLTLNQQHNHVKRPNVIQATAGGTTFDNSVKLLKACLQMTPNSWFRILPNDEKTKSYTVTWKSKSTWNCRYIIMFPVDRLPTVSVFTKFKCWN